MVISYRLAIRFDVFFKLYVRYRESVLACSVSLNFYLTKIGTFADIKIRLIEAGYWRDIRPIPRTTNAFVERALTKYGLYIQFSNTGRCSVVELGQKSFRKRIEIQLSPNTGFF